LTDIGYKERVTKKSEAWGMDIFNRGGGLQNARKPFIPSLSTIKPETPGELTRRKKATNLRRNKTK